MAVPADNSMRTVKCLLLSTQNGTVLVPNACVSEIIASQKVMHVDHAPSWLLGAVEWRGQVLPLISFEKLTSDEAFEFSAKVPFVVLKRLSEGGTSAFYASYIHGIPHFEVLKRDGLQEYSENERPFMSKQVKIGSEVAYIPDLEAVELLMDDELPALPKPVLA